MGKPEKPITKEDLERLYVQERRSVKELAAFFSCNASTLLRHLHRKGIRVRTTSEEMTGRVLSPEHRAKVVMTLRNERGESNPNWKGGKSWKGRSKDAAYIIVRHDGRYVPEHRLVAERAIGRKLHPKEHVHHIDGNKTNNDPINLMVLTAKEHAKLHMTPEHRAHLAAKTKAARAARLWSTKKKPLPDYNPT